MQAHSIAGSGLAATINAEGAQLSSLRDRHGREYLWQAHAAWPWHAPVLFPIVGELKNEQYRHHGKTYRMLRHGFARRSRFTWTELSETSCRLALTDSDATRAVYPFGFRFEVEYAIAGGMLAVAFTITNTGDEILPAAMGAHPAFNWPLLPGIPKSEHWLDFEQVEPYPVRRLERGLLMPEKVPSPIDGRELRLDESLFVADAIILKQPLSRSLRYAGPDTPTVEVSWDGFPQLGIWSPPTGVDLLCIEPWSGYASPIDFDGEITDKPGMLLIPPGGVRAATHSIRIT